MIRKISLLSLAILLPAVILILFSHQTTSAAITAKLGCKPLSLTVHTDQTFYITVAVTDTTDLYAWQMDASYNKNYLEFDRIVPGDHLRSDGALYYLVTPTVVTGTTTNVMHLAAYTRLSKDVGVDGGGSIAHIFFRAKTQILGGTNMTLNATPLKLVDHNALDITKSLVNSGNCKVIISDSAPELQQNPVGELVFLPIILR
jgi:hypothetical protein